MCGVPVNRRRPTFSTRALACSSNAAGRQGKSYNQPGAIKPLSLGYTGFYVRSSRQSPPANIQHQSSGLFIERSRPPRKELQPAWSNKTAFPRLYWLLCAEFPSIAAGQHSAPELWLVHRTQQAAKERATTSLEQ